MARFISIFVFLVSLLLVPAAFQSAEAGPVGKALGELGMDAETQNLGDALQSELAALKTQGNTVRGASGALSELALNSGELICNSWLIGFNVKIRNMIIENEKLSGDAKIRHLQAITKMREFVSKLELECTRVGLIGDGGPAGEESVEETEEEPEQEEEETEAEAEDDGRIKPLPGETVGDAICRHRCQAAFDKMREWEKSLKSAEKISNEAAQKAAGLQKRLTKLEADLAESKAKVAKAKKAVKKTIYPDSTFQERQAVIRAGKDLSIYEPAVARLSGEVASVSAALKKAQAEAKSWQDHLKWVKGHTEKARNVYFDCIRNCVKQAKAAGEKMTLTCPDDYPCVSAGTGSAPVQEKPEPKETRTSYVCPMPPAHLAAVVGANDKIGSGARLKNKVKEAFGGGFGVGGSGGNSIGGGFGQGRSTFGSGGGRPAIGPKPDLDDDPIDDDDKVTQEAQGVELASGALWTDEGLLVSISIEDSPGDGTFQSVFLEDSEGRRRAPDEIRLYGLWHEWHLSVTWTYRAWVDNELVKEESGGWSADGRNVYVVSSLTEGTAQDAGLWRMMGFKTANKGMRSIGALFKIRREDLARPMDLVVHTTLPEESPVTTVPIVGRLFRQGGKDERNLDVLIRPTLATIAQENNCY
ncbi:hypothetical protein [Denitrobaculum tricleocarpae]|uniref:Uncharacterized protein n=1 Tax=Denitrobaculum tricleocarpae TaxID=2591009 RepID=A0A545TKP7_9PROT|nr:hypothetical protein [Denitrobaculum tricleocarpae]TQV77802.1 hypothetical protein FKG95_19790 [Denitrobaculum tricleocarpae]